MEARFFSAKDAERWDEFCGRAHGATFLHTRRFLSYHGERFIDRSLVVAEGDAWLGVIPAAQHPTLADCVVSHPGITYGGIVHHGALRGIRMLQALEAAGRAWASAGYARLQYKAVPHIYHLAPAQEDLYALFRLGTVRYRCDLASCIDLHHRLTPGSRRIRARKTAGQAGVQVRTTTDPAALWPVLEENLQRKHGAKPVHSLQEIRLLMERFPDHIRVVVAEVAGRVEAGVVMFLSPTVAHAQYIASSARGYEVNALDAVFEAEIASSMAAGRRFFDFGISTEDGGRVLNEGLNTFKNEFGAGGVAYEFYELELSRPSA